MDEVAKGYKQETGDFVCSLISSSKPEDPLYCTTASLAVFVGLVGAQVIRTLGADAGLCANSEPPAWHGKHGL